MRSILAASAATIIVGMATPAAAALVWHTDRAAFIAAAPSSIDPTGMSGVTTDAQAIALQETAPSVWRNTYLEDQYDITLGQVTISQGIQGPITSHTFSMNIDGGTTGSSVGFTGASYRIGNPLDENHSYTISGGGALAFGFNIYEPRTASQCGNVPCVISRFTFEAFDANGTSLGARVYDFGAQAEMAFIGLVSTTPFTRLTVTESQLSTGCCRYDNEYFGNYLLTAANATTGVPEPATWAMMMLGFGAMGAALRRRQNVVSRIRFA